MARTLVMLSANWTPNRERLSVSQSALGLFAASRARGGRQWGDDSRLEAGRWSFFRLESLVLNPALPVRSAGSYAGTTPGRQATHRRVLPTCLGHDRSRPDDRRTRRGVGTALVSRHHQITWGFFDRMTTDGDLWPSRGFTRRSTPTRRRDTTCERSPSTTARQPVCPAENAKPAPPPIVPPLQSHNAATTPKALAPVRTSDATTARAETTRHSPRSDRAVDYPVPSRNAVNLLAEMFHVLPPLSQANSTAWPGEAA
jgi:hypothetical protein